MGSILTSLFSFNQETRLARELRAEFSGDWAVELRLTMDNGDSSQMITKARDGDRGVLERLLLLSYGDLERHIENHLGSSLQIACDRDDVLQQVLTKAFMKFSSFEGNNQESLLAWLRTIADHTIRDIARAQNRLKRGRGQLRISWQDDLGFQRLSRLIPRDETTGSRQLSQEELRQAIQLGIAELPRDYQEVIHRFYYHDQAIAQIARDMSRSEGAIRGLLDRAKLRLRDTFDRASRWLG